ncbi:replication initiator protein A [Acetobacter fallax]|uniref:replication initiator protein A n=1 Tax=Acetobacter fallax TaxID=1737473 RepID=UPI001F548E96|nr:replication initiator protein A [Acetobacter fallax]
MGNEHKNPSSLPVAAERLGLRRKITSIVRKSPPGSDQPDFFVPALYDVGTRDSRSIMDVAVFRLSKKDKRAGDAIRYDFPDGGYVEVTSGHYGMASVWDYDLVLMAISHLTEAMNRYRNGKGEIPSPVFRPHISEILKFCRRSIGGRQYKEIESALDRLADTKIKVVRKENGVGRRERRIAGTPQGLISSGRVVSYTDTGQIQSVEITIPDWLYQEIVESKTPNVLTVHPDYFLIEPGIGRFLYRLARRAAGRTEAKWSFQTIYDRSGSTGTFKKFSENLRKIIVADDLPQYALLEEKGQNGPQLVMQHRCMQLEAPFGP